MTTDQIVSKVEKFFSPDIRVKIDVKESILGYELITVTSIHKLIGVCVVGMNLNDLLKTGLCVEAILP